MLLSLLPGYFSLAFFLQTILGLSAHLPPCNIVLLAPPMACPSLPSVFVSSPAIAVNMPFLLDTTVLLSPCATARESVGNGEWPGLDRPPDFDARYDLVAINCALVAVLRVGEMDDHSKNLGYHSLG